MLILEGEEQLCSLRFGLHEKRGSQTNSYVLFDLVLEEYLLPFGYRSPRPP